MGCVSSTYRLKMTSDRGVHFIQVWKNDKQIPISQLEFVLRRMRLKKYVRKFHIIGSTRVSDRQRKDKGIYSSIPILLIRGLKKTRISTFAWDFIYKIHENLGSSCETPQFSVKLPYLFLT